MSQDQSERECEFCAEFRPPFDSRFRAHFGATADARTVLIESGFVVMPSMGQIVSNSLMLVPVRHVERFADIDLQNLRTAEGILARLRAAVGGQVAIFEHGARSCTGGSCGIYHAHIHFVPLPDGLNIDVLADDFPSVVTPFPATIASAFDCDQYLFLWDGGNRMWLRPVSPGESSRFPSQYFRRVLAAATGRAADWDWRRTVQPEMALMKSYRHWIRAVSSFAVPAEYGGGYPD